MSEAFMALIVRKEESSKVPVSKSKVGDVRIDEGSTKTKEGFKIFEYEVFDGNVVEKVTSLLESLVENKVESLRVYISNEYGTEYFMMILNGIVKAYQFDDGDESEHVVSAYDMWHEGLGGLWYGYNDKDIIDEMREEFGSYNDEGTESNLSEVDYRSSVSAKEKFENTKFDIPHASKKWMSHIDIFESNARQAAVKCKFPAEDGAVEFLRTYKLAGCIGYAFSWMNGGKEIVFLQELLGECSASLGMIVNHANYDIEHVIVMFNQVDWLADDIQGEDEWFVWDLPDSVQPIMGQNL